MLVLLLKWKLKRLSTLIVYKSGVGYSICPNFIHIRFNFDVALNRYKANMVFFIDMKLAEV